MTRTRCSSGQVVLPFVLAMTLLTVVPGVADFPGCSGWQWVGPVPTGTVLNGVASNGEHLVAVSRDGVVLTSQDGFAWQRWDDPEQARFAGAAWGNGRFVVVGQESILAGIGDGRWERRPGPGVPVDGVFWGGGQFLVLGWNEVLLSGDGFEWEQVSLIQNGLYSAWWHDGLWVAVGRGGSVRTSADGRSWQLRRPSEGPVHLRSVTWGLGRWVAVGAEGAVVTSTDGIQWVEQRLPGVQSLTGVAALTDRLVAVGSFGVAAVSQDGVSWEVGSTPNSYSGLVRHDGAVFAVYWSGVDTSPDGVTWNRIGHPGLLRVAGGGSGFVAVGLEGTALFSPDGRVWQRGGTQVEVTLRGVAAGAGRWVAVGDEGVILTSEDGLTWQSRPSGATDTLGSVAWGVPGFVAIGNTGAVLRSADGLDWNPSGGSTLPGSAQVIWAGNVYLAVSSAGIHASSNGIDWDQRETFSDGRKAADLAWNGLHTLAVGEASIISSDGMVWEELLPGPPGPLHAPVWTGERFTAAEDSLPSAAVHSSRDGVIWWPEQLPQQYAVRDARVLSMAAWAGTLVAVGDRNTLLVASCGGGESYVPGVARNPGFQGTVWCSDLAVFNPGATRQEFVLQLLERGRANPDPESAFFALDPGLAVRYPDLVRTVFDRTTSGTVRISTTPGSAPLAVAGRTYNDAPEGSFGQGLGVLDSRAAVPAGRVAILPQLAHSASMEVGFRTNIGLVNVSAGEIVVEIEAVSGNGQLLGWLEETLLPYEHRQLDNVLARFTGGDVAVAYAALYTRTPEARFLAYASVVDNRTGDPTLILPL